jgi:hypothetical protein
VPNEHGKPKNTSTGPLQITTYQYDMQCLHYIYGFLPASHLSIKWEGGSFSCECPKIDILESKKITSIYHQVAIFLRVRAHVSKSRCIGVTAYRSSGLGRRSLQCQYSHQLQAVGLVDKRCIPIGNILVEDRTDRFLASLSQELNYSTGSCIMVLVPLLREGQQWI